MPKSKSDVHETPDKVFDIIHDTWGISKSDMFDPCPVDHTFDGLGIIWGKMNYVNPPYTLLREFVDKAIISKHSHGCTSILLLPAKTDQQWFHDIIKYDFEIKWIKGRLKFKNNVNSATQPHFLVMIK